MTKIFLSLVVLGTVSFANAQTTGKQASKNTTQSSAASKQTKKTIRTDTISNRKVFLSKKTGQKATKTGQQATGTNGSHAALPKNAVRKKD
jgi:hypothetical protein